MKPTLTYDDSNLWKLMESLDLKKRMSALKGGFRREANRVKKTAIQNLRADVNSNAALERGVRGLVWKEKPGFRVTVGERRANKKGKGEAGFYQSRSMKRGVPVLRWLDTGTKKRKFKGGNRGGLDARGFMAKTKSQVSSTVTESLRQNITKSIISKAKKYGCK